MQEANKNDKQYIYNTLLYWIFTQQRTDLEFSVLTSLFKLNSPKDEYMLCSIKKGPSQNYQTFKEAFCHAKLLIVWGNISLNKKTFSCWGSFIQIKFSATFQIKLSATFQVKLSAVCGCIVSSKTFSCLGKNCFKSNF